MAATMSMIIIGMKLSETPGIRVLLSWDVLTGTLTKLLIAPGVTYLLQKS